jgi:hypothetical protein
MKNEISVEKLFLSSSLLIQRFESKSIGANKIKRACIVRQLRESLTYWMNRSIPSCATWEVMEDTLIITINEFLG